MIPRFLQTLPSFREKVIWTLTFTGGFAVLLVSAAMLVFAWVGLRNEAMSSVASQSRLVAMNSGAPLAFQDADSAREALASLRGTPHVAAATLFDVDGRRFASFLRDGMEPPPPRPAAPGLTVTGRWHVLTTPVSDVGQRLGQLQVVYDLERVERRITTALIAALLIAASAMLLIHVIARRIGSVLVRPLAQLAQAARDVSQTRDYTLRVARSSDDEVGQFTDDFNAMLGEIQQQHAEIQRARRDAERVSQVKDEFLATLSHELRTPMTPILGWAQILMRSGNEPQRVRQGAEIIERNARIQTQLIDDLLDMSRIVSGKMAFRMQPVAPAEIAAAALATVQPTADNRGVALALDVEPDLPAVLADPARLQQVLWNLLSNAIKFTPRGGRVRLSLRRDGDELAVEVHDTGQGIDARFLPHVFERFRQEDSSTTRVHGGLGLGLSIVKHLVEQHGGRIEAASDGVGQGATFTLRLPASRQQPPAETSSAAAEGAGPRAATPLWGMRLLVVDDDADARRLLAHLLSEAGASVDAAASVDEALALLPLRRPDVLVTDIGMPGRDGYELVRSMRRLPSEQGGATPAIAFTAFARDEDRERALEAGFQLHVGKPVEVPELIASVARLRARG